MRFKEGIRDVEALRVLQIRTNSTGGYDWIKVIQLHVLSLFVSGNYCQECTCTAVHMQFPNKDQFSSCVFFATESLAFMTRG